MDKRIKLTMAQALVRFLDQQYVEYDGEETKFVEAMFGIFGHGSVIGIGEALENMEHSLTFHQGKSEQGMALAAMAYAKQNNRLKIIPCISSIGPGATNMVTAAACATANRIPLLVLPGDTFACRQPDPVLQQVEMFHAIDTTVNDSFRAVCHFFDRVSRPEQLMTSLINAMRVLTDPADTGAVCIALPQDVQGEAYDYPSYFFDKRVWHIDRRPLAESQLDRLSKMIEASKKPFLILGGGVRYSKAGESFQKLAEQCVIPFGSTQAGKGTIDWRHPLNMGGIGITGTGCANRLAREADLIIGVGTRFSDFTTCSKWLFQNPNVQFVSINICPFDAYKMNAEAIVADARETLDGVTPHLADYKSAWNKALIKEEKESFDEIIDHYYSLPDSPELMQTTAVGIINEFAGESGIVVCAAGSLPGDLQRFWRPGWEHGYHVEYGYSNMGYDMNGAMGVKMAAPDCEVFAMVGDGGYFMLNSELHTMVQELLKVHIFIFDNSGWGCIESLQNSHGGDSYGTVFRSRSKETGKLDQKLIPVDFAMNARSLGAVGYTVRTSDDLREALEDSRKYEDVPIVFDLKVKPGSMSPGFEDWWRVGVAEVSENEKVREAYRELMQEVRKTRDY